MLNYSLRKEGVKAVELVTKGKTKDVYRLDNGKYLFKFKDDLTGEDGVFNPGADTVGLTVQGAGRAALKLTKYFFEILEEAGIPTHYIDANVEEGTMTVEPATMFGHGLEFICRYRAVGSFLNRYGLYIEEGEKLDGLVEVTLKDDKRNDPLVTRDTLHMLNILSYQEYDLLKDLTVKICNIIKRELAKKGIELYDIKLEFGKIGEDQRIALIDEISGGSMRAYKDGKHIKPLELEKLMLG